MQSLIGKRAFVTGGSRGIGSAIARRLAAEGADVAIAYEQSNAAAQVIVEELRNAGRRAVAIKMDAASPDSVREAVDRAAAELGGLDILVNNAGIMRTGPVEAMSIQDIDDTLAVNIRAVLLASQAALAYLPNGGRIIIIGSNLAEQVPTAGISLYSMSKAALIGWTKGLARDLGPRGITVNIVHPGSTDTDMNPATGPGLEAKLSRMAIKAYGRAEDVAALVAFVARDEARSINGSRLTIDGGANA